MSLVNQFTDVIVNFIVVVCLLRLVPEDKTIIAMVLILVIMLWNFYYGKQVRSVEIAKLLMEEANKYLEKVDEA